MKTVIVTPGALGLAVAFDDIRVAVIKAIKPSCNHKDDFRVGDHILTIDGKKVSKLEDLRVGSDGQRRMGIVRMSSDGGAAGNKRKRDNDNNNNTRSGPRNRKEASYKEDGEGSNHEEEDGGDDFDAQSSCDDDDDDAEEGQSDDGAAVVMVPKIPPFPGTDNASSPSSSFDIEQCSSMQRLEQRVTHLHKMIRRNNIELRMAQERIEQLNDNAGRSSSRSSNYSSNTKQGGNASTHGDNKRNKFGTRDRIDDGQMADDNKCAIQGCRNVPQHRGLCARHGGKRKHPSSGNNDNDVVPNTRKGGYSRTTRHHYNNSGGSNNNGNGNGKLPATVRSPQQRVAKKTREKKTVVADGTLTNRGDVKASVQFYCAVPGCGTRAVRWGLCVRHKSEMPFDVDGIIEGFGGNGGNNGGVGGSGVGGSGNNGGSGKKRRGRPRKARASETATSSEIVEKKRVRNTTTMAEIVQVGDDDDDKEAENAMSETVDDDDEQVQNASPGEPANDEEEEQIDEGGLEDLEEAEISECESTS